ncbi:MAG: heme-binding protein [Halosimplex sp.]
MVRTRTAIAGVLGGAVAAAGAWTLYQRRTTETVPYTTVARLDDVELRRYPATVTVETVAPSENEAFRRLFRYIAGDNEGEREIEMTAPVAVTDRDASRPSAAPKAVTPGQRIPMTAPVETTDTSGGVRMAFYLPPEYDYESAPVPTDESVDLVAIPERTLAVRRFSWVPTDRRVASETERLLSKLDAAGVATTGEPFFMGYDAPGALPFLRRNEVAVAVDAS